MSIILSLELTIIQTKLLDQLLILLAISSQITCFTVSRVLSCSQISLIQMLFIHKVANSEVNHFKLAK